MKTKPIENKALEFLQKVGKDHFVVHEESRHGYWFLFFFMYRGYRFSGGAHMNGIEMFLAIRDIAKVKYSPEILEKIRTLCDNVHKNALFGHVIHTEDLETKTISIDLRVGFVYPSEDSFWYCVNYLMGGAMEIQDDVESLIKADSGTQAKTHNERRWHVDDELYEEIIRAIEENRKASTEETGKATQEKPNNEIIEIPDDIDPSNSKWDLPF